MRTLFFLFTLFLFPLSASGKIYYQQVQKGLDKIINASEKKAHIGVEVISLKSGIRIYERNSNQLYTPANNLKLFTAGAALSILGPNYRFETTLLTDGKIEEGILKGNLFIQGSGDPSFTLADLENLTLQLRLQQVKQIDGDIILDTSAFDEVADGPGWMWDDINGKGYAPVNALTINRNCVQLWVQPAENIANAPKVFAYPKTNLVAIENMASTEENADTLTVERSLKTKHNTVLVKGEINKKSAIREFAIPVNHSHLYMGSLLQSILKKSGITYSGSLQIQKAPQNATVIAKHISAPVSELIRPILKDSDNLYADNFFKALGMAYSNTQGSWKTGKAAILSHLENDAVMNIADLVVVDGSGLSRYNLASPHNIASYLVWAYKMPYSAEFVSSLSIAGVDGTLSERFTNLTPNLRAKTGTMTGVSALSGYIQTKDGEVLAFSILSNGKTSRKVYAVEEEICTHLANLSKN